MPDIDNTVGTNEQTAPRPIGEIEVQGNLLRRPEGYENWREQVVVNAMDLIETTQALEEQVINETESLVERGDLTPEQVGQINQVVQEALTENEINAGPQVYVGIGDYTTERIELPTQQNYTTNTNEIQVEENVVQYGYTGGLDIVDDIEPEQQATQRARRRNNTTARINTTTATTGYTTVTAGGNYTQGDTDVRADSGGGRMINTNTNTIPFTLYDDSGVWILRIRNNGSVEYSKDGSPEIQAMDFWRYVDMHGKQIMARTKQLEEDLNTVVSLNAELKAKIADLEYKLLVSESNKSKKSARSKKSSDE